MKIILKWGLITGTTSFLWLILEMVLGWHDQYIEYHPFLTTLGWIVPIIGIHLGNIEFRKNALHIPTYWKIFGNGIYVVLLYTLLSVLGLYVFVTYVTPDFFDKMMDGSEKMAIKNKFDIEKVRIQAKEYFTLKSYLQETLIGSGIFGLMVNFISAYIVHRKVRVGQTKS